MPSDEETFARFTEFIKTLVKNPLFWLALVFLLALALLLRFGLDGLLVGFVLIILLVVVLIWFNRPNPHQQLLNERTRLLEELSIADKKMLRRELSADLFTSIAREKQARLIEIDALLHESTSSPSTPRAHENDKLDALEARRRHTLKALLEEQALARQVLKVANQKFLKHQIDNQAFERLTREKQEELLQIEAKIADVYRNEARDIMNRAKNRLKSADSFDQESTVTEQVASELRSRDEK